MNKFVAVLPLILAGLSIYFGVEGKNNSCQHGTLLLGRWLVGSGLSLIMISVICNILFLCGMEASSSLYNSLIADALAWTGWWIWGVTIISNPVNKNCLYQGTGLGVMTMVVLLCGKIRFIYLWAVRKKLKELPRRQDALIGNDLSV